ncbi:MAG: zinc ABC transporter substrate-binding protein, partial [Cyanobacteria bacterium J06639_18]
MSRRSLAHITFGITLITLSVGLFGCNNRNQVKETSKPSATTVNSSKANKNLPKVLTTTNIICDLTKQIAADTIRIKCLIPSKVNPHLYKPKSEDSKAIEQAQLILFNGYDLESKLIELIENSNNSVPKIPVAEAAVPKPRKLKLNGKNLADPHVWHDAENGIEMAKVINENLAKLSPENASVYAKNTKKINSELKQIDRWIKSRVASIPDRKRKFVTTHDAM